MEKEIKVSIIVPVYNVEETLEECLDSILRQTLKEIEVICVNDGSTDGSKEILTRYAKLDKRLVVINQDNAGAGAARNTGVAKACGTYLGFVDSDDIVYPDMYERMYQKAVRTEADMVIMGEVETAQGDTIRFPPPGDTATAEELSLGTFQAVEYPEILQNVFLWNRIYRTAFWREEGMSVPEGRKFAEDLLICTQTAVLARRIAYVEGPLYFYRNNRGGSLSDTLAKDGRKDDYLKAVRETKAFLEGVGLYPFFAQPFLSFSAHIFALQQRTIKDYRNFLAFVTGMSGLLSKEDRDVLKETWLIEEYPEIFAAMESGNWKKVYRRNWGLRMFG